LEGIEAMGGNNNCCMGEIGGKKQGGPTCGFIYSTLNSYINISQKIKELLGMVSLGKDIINISIFGK